MKIRPWILAVCLVMVALACIRFRIQTMNNADNPRRATPQEIKIRIQEDIANKYAAQQNNGSSRGGLTEAQVSPEAIQLADDYKKIIYPSILATIHDIHHLPYGIHGLHKFPNRDAYCLRNPKWAVGFTYRPDGTVVFRDMYSRDAPNSPHDVWAQYAIVDEGHPQNTLCIDGWDDGTVTFDLWPTFYQNEVDTAFGEHNVAAPPGAAGIPPDLKPQSFILGPAKPM